MKLKITLSKRCCPLRVQFLAELAILLSLFSINKEHEDFHACNSDVSSGTFGQSKFRTLGSRHGHSADRSDHISRTISIIVGLLYHSIQCSGIFTISLSMHSFGAPLTRAPEHNGCQKC